MPSPPQPLSPAASGDRQEQAGTVRGVSEARRDSLPFTSPLDSAFSPAASNPQPLSPPEASLSSSSGGGRGGEENEEQPLPPTQTPSHQQQQQQQSAAAVDFFCHRCGRRCEVVEVEGGDLRCSFCNTEGFVERLDAESASALFPAPFPFSSSAVSAAPGASAESEWWTPPPTAALPPEGAALLEVLRLQSEAVSRLVESFAQPG